MSTDFESVDEVYASCCRKWQSSRWKICLFDCVSKLVILLLLLLILKIFTPDLSSPLILCESRITVRFLLANKLLRFENCRPICIVLQMARGEHRYLGQLTDNTVSQMSSKSLNIFQIVRKLCCLQIYPSSSSIPPCTPPPPPPLQLRHLKMAKKEEKKTASKNSCSVSAAAGIKIACSFQTPVTLLACNTAHEKKKKQLARYGDCPHRCPL